MPLANGKDVLEHALKNKYAVGAFNANGAEYVQAITWAAQEEAAPVIVQISPGATKYLGLKMAVAIVRAAADEVDVPVVLHLDHGVTYQQNIDCLNAGFTSLMFDGSELPLEQNIETTLKIVEEAHAKSVPVEAELGKIPKIEDYLSLLPEDYDYSYPPIVVGKIRDSVMDLMAKPEDVERFVLGTQCDSLAAAVGSIHALKNDVQPLCIERLREIRERLKALGIDMPIVSHGSSGIVRTCEEMEHIRQVSEERGFRIPEGWGSLEEAIEEGLVKVNVATAISMAFLKGMKEYWDKNPKEKDSRKVTGPGRDAMKEAVKGYMRLFKCSMKAGEVRARTEEEAMEGPE